MKPIIKIENLSKQYRIGALQAPYGTLRESLTRTVRAPFKLLRHNGRTGHVSIWALKDISFEVSPGEVVGIIGRNGAGKSTLLKVLSRITEPTTGRVELYGRVGSLLEVGTGFHPELTGRENIYLNGTILGMRRQEIRNKFDEIIAFAEIEKFIDTPVKHYSTGMYLRLAFAVAAHLEPEILVVDEVLAVGDASFQKRCIGKMESVAKEGRTVLFVSHNMQAVARLCSRVVLLSSGKVGSVGTTSSVIAEYLHLVHGAQRKWSDLEAAPGDEVVRLREVSVVTESGVVQDLFDIRQPIIVKIEYTVMTPIKKLMAEIDIYNEDGTLLFASLDQYEEESLTVRRAGSYRSECQIPGNLMAEGTFFVRVGLIDLNVPPKKHVLEKDVVCFQVVDPMEGGSTRGQIAQSYPGVIRPMLSWSTQFVDRPESAAQ